MIHTIENQLRTEMKALLTESSRHSNIGIILQIALIVSFAIYKEKYLAVIEHPISIYVFTALSSSINLNFLESHLILLEKFVKKRTIRNPFEEELFIFLKSKGWWQYSFLHLTNSRFIYGWCRRSNKAITDYLQE